MAIIMVLLTVLGVAVGATAEIFLRNMLYEQVQTQLNLAVRPGNRGAQPHNGGNIDNQGSYNSMPPFNPDRPFGGSQANSIALNVTSVEPQGGIIRRYTTADGSPELKYDPLTQEALAELRKLPTDGTTTRIYLDDYGDYMAAAVMDNRGNLRINAISLEDANAILQKVALVTASGIVIALIVAGWTGAFIVRGTLRPLRRVAATATRVSELKLDRGEVQLAQRVPTRDTDPNTEVGQVGAALNRMLDHVGSALEARHASEMQVRQFVADASHELRTPLAAIRGYAELSRRSRAPVSDEIAHVLGRVESEAKRMTGLVEDLLLLARLDAGRPLAHDPVDLTMMVVDAISDAHAAGPRHYWQLDLPEEPVFVIGDGARLHQVLANLLANARTHTPEGTAVTVRVGATPDAAIMQVIDGGPGIPSELQPHIFERFARGDSSRSRAAGSTGLGLSIVHAVVTAHRGSVSVKSVPGQTVFTVVLPLMPPSHKPSAGPATGMYPVSPSGQFAQITPGRR